jgi:hypothetical protein
VICTTNCTESSLHQTISFFTQISTILPSGALVLSNCAPFPIGFQCGAYLSSQLQRSGFHHCRDLPSKKHPSASFALFILLPCAYVIRGPLLQDQDWTVQSRDENLATIANTLQTHQTLVFTSDRRLSVAQLFCLFTSIVNVGHGPFTGSDSTALPPLRKQRLRHESSSDRFDSLFQNAPLAPLWFEPLHLCG